MVQRYDKNLNHPNKSIIFLSSPCQTAPFQPYQSTGELPCVDKTAALFPQGYRL